MKKLILATLLSAAIGGRAISGSGEKRHADERSDANQGRHAHEG